jgi:phage tail tape-measure protein
MALGAAFQVADTYQNAKTPNEKAEGYGGAAGGLAGGLAGAAAGAAIGSFVPIVGTLIGGLIGGAIGSWGGGEVGATVGKAAFGRDVPGAQGRPLMLPMASPAPVPGDVIRSLAAGSASAPVTPLMLTQAAGSPKAAPTKVDQKFSFAPQSTITVQGDVKDPEKLAESLAPYWRRQFEDFSREVQSRQLYDSPDAG